MKAGRPIFLVRLMPNTGVDPIRALRAALKMLLRRFGLRAISVDQEEQPNRTASDDRA